MVPGSSDQDQWTDLVSFALLLCIPVLWTLLVVVFFIFLSSQKSFRSELGSRTRDELRLQRPKAGGVFWLG